MNDARLMERLAWADEYPPTTPLPDDIWKVDAISREVERRTGMTQTTNPKAPETGRPPGRTRMALVAAAAFVVVILLGAAIWAATARQTEGEVIDAPPTTAAVPTTQAAPATPETVATDIAFVERFVDTWFESGESLLSIAMIGEADGDITEEDQAHSREVTYQAAIGADVSVTDCVPVDGQRVYGCLMSYSNMLFEAVDAPPFISEMQFEVISDGRIAPIPDDLYPGSNNGITLEWFLFEEEMGLAAESSCKPYGSDSVACPALQREHLDEFLAWRASPEKEAADIAFIGRFVDTWFESFDPMTAMAMVGGEANADPGAAEIRSEEDQAHISEITYQAAMEADVSVSDCVPGDGRRIFACTVSYSNMLFEAVDAPPSITEMEFKVISDALVAPMAEGAYPGNNDITAAWLRFQDESGIAGESECKSYGSHSVACPALQREHLDAFAAWWATNG